MVWDVAQLVECLLLGAGSHYDPLYHIHKVIWTCDPIAQEEETGEVHGPIVYSRPA